MSNRQTDTEALEQALTEWPKDHTGLYERRDRLVLSAVAAGITKHRIHVLSKIARTTIDDILAKAGDPEMREALVRGIAQYILRGEMHTKRAPHSDAQILARARHDVAEMTAYDYIFPEGEAERIAADAEELARWQQDHNPNWDQWAQGY
jgi:hypothetical protein